MGVGPFFMIDDIDDFVESIFGRKLINILVNV